MDARQMKLRPVVPRVPRGKGRKPGPESEEEALRAKALALMAARFRGRPAEAPDKLTPAPGAVKLLRRAGERPGARGG